MGETMNILVTGCMGFIGSNLVSDLLNQGHKIIGLDNLSRPSINPTDRMKKKSGKNWDNFTFFRFDICNLDDMKSVVAASPKLDAIIHLAAIGSVPLSFVQPAKSMNANVVGFANIIELVRAFEIPKLVFASSSSVYGLSPENPRKEGREGKLLCPYSLSKRVNEELAILLMPHDSTFVGLRFFNVYGPGQSMLGYYTPVIPRFLTEEVPEVNGDGETIRDYTYVDDVSEAICKSLYLKQSAVLNVGTGSRTSLNELLDLIGKRDKAIYKEPRRGDVRQSWADTSNINNLLKWSANINIKQGLALTKEFYDDFMKQGIDKENA
jgi:UDP-N-acetylglucosamine 4-epimerase